MVRCLLEIATSQTRCRRRTKTPTLVPAVITHTGELSPAAILLIERITLQVAKSYNKGIFTLGLSKKRVTSAFRTRLKDAVMCANARGFGRALLSAGSPMPGLLLNPADDDLLLPNWNCANY